MLQLSAALLGASLAFTPVLGLSQQQPRPRPGPSPETAIPRHTDKDGKSNLAPPRDRTLPPDPHHEIPAHPNRPEHTRSTKKAKTGSTGGTGTEKPPQM